MKSTRAKDVTEKKYRAVATAEPAPANAAWMRPTLAGAPDLATATSPARALQEELSARWAKATANEKWSKRNTVLFVVGTCGAFWALAIWAVSAVVQS